MKSHLISAAGAACLVLGSFGAQASSSASGTLSGFTLQLFDLNPLDGIAPTVTFTGTYGTYV